MIAKTDFSGKNPQIFGAAAPIAPHANIFTQILTFLTKGSKKIINFSRVPLARSVTLWKSSSILSSSSPVRKIFLATLCNTYSNTKFT